MRIASILMITVTSFAIVGCSGKVQTNALPDVKKYHLPTDFDTKQLNTSLAYYGNQWNEFLEEFFKKNNPSINRSIWQIGLDRRHYEH